MTVIKFAKLRPDAKIPSKEAENAGYDIYASFDEDYIIIGSNETVMIPTGICSAFSKDYVMILKERGSSGSKGIGQRSGVIDSGYRGEWFVPITNHSNKTLVVSKVPLDKILEEYRKNFAVSSLDDCACCSLIQADNFILYPYEKAIAQALLLPVPKAVICEVCPEDIQAIASDRGTGALGSSGK